VLVAAFAMLARRGPAPVVPPVAQSERATAVSLRLLGAARAIAGKDEAALDAYEKALALGAEPDEAMTTNLDGWSKSKKSATVRARARELAGFAGINLDLVGSYTADLERGASCKERRDAIPHLRALRDKKAIPVLRRAFGRRGGLLNLERVNECLERD